MYLVTLVENSMRPLITNLPSSRIISSQRNTTQWSNGGVSWKTAANKPFPTSLFVLAKRYGAKVHLRDISLFFILTKARHTVVMTRLERNLEKFVSTVPYHVFFDNQFTTIHLLIELNKRGYDASGTHRTDRLDRACADPTSVTMENMDRGSLASAVGKMGCTSITFTRWKANSVVTLASILRGEKPSGNTRRWWGEKKEASASESSPCYWCLQ